MADLNLEIPTTKLPNGAQMPVIGFGLGTAAADNKKEGGIFSSVDKDLVQIVEKAISLGYYHLDGSESYGTEAELGAAVKNSKLPREKFFISTKVSRESSIQDLAGALDRSLKELGLDYVDLYLIHTPFWSNDDEKQLQDKWKEMEELQKSGKTKAIGVSNFIQHQIEAVLKTAEIPPMVNQIEYHPYLQHHGLVKWLQNHNIQVSGYAPLTPAIRAKGKSPEMDQLLDDLAKKYYVSPGEILLRWCIDQDVIPLTTTAKEIRMSDYLRTLTFKLTPKEHEDISVAGRQVHHRGFWAKKYAEDDRR